MAELKKTPTRYRKRRSDKRPQLRLATDVSSAGGMASASPTDYATPLSLTSSQPASPALYQGSNGSNLSFTPGIDELITPGIDELITLDKEDYLASPHSDHMFSGGVLSDNYNQHFFQKKPDPKDIVFPEYTKTEYKPSRPSGEVVRSKSTRSTRREPARVRSQSRSRSLKNYSSGDKKPPGAHAARNSSRTRRGGGGSGAAATHARKPEMLQIPVRLPTQTVIKELSDDQQISQILEQLVSDHRYELTYEETAASEYMLWEVCEEAKVRRPLRGQEFLRYIRESWEAVSMNYIDVTPSSHRLDSGSIASLVPRRDIINLEDGPVYHGKIYYRRPGGDWRKGWLDVTSGVLALRKREGARELRQINLSEFDIYESTSSSGGPGKGLYWWCLRSQQSPDFFMEKSDALIHMAVDSQTEYEILRNNFFSMRTQFVDKQVKAYQQVLSGKVPDQTNLLLSRRSTQTKREEEDIPLAKLSLQPKPTNLIDSIPTVPEFTKSGLLGANYDKQAQKAMSSHHQHQANIVDSYHAFTPNSLLAKSVKSPTQFEGRGLMAQLSKKSPTLQSPTGASGRKPLPQHSMAVQHQLR
ncbi:hypothetical protein TRVA0_026S02124 [Trichomonascus vanleenenianus]|uniref:uncharacterized protein n=1 Tax=Trichomonascus vanleenenianus TaxID=2268995 RepID=UPI003ECA2D68